MLYIMFMQTIYITYIYIYYSVEISPYIRNITQSELRIKP